MKLFIDSGAFTARSKGKPIDIKQYIAFLKSNMNDIHIYSNLDVIGDAKETYKNQKRMEAEGLHPIPVFHHGSDEKYLKAYLKKHDYIAIGGIAKKGRGKDLNKWLHYLFKTFFIPDGIKVHGFGMTAMSFILNHPWKSVDSSTWILHGGLGLINLPQNPSCKKKSDFYTKTYAVTSYVNDGDHGQPSIPGMANIGIGNKLDSVLKKGSIMRARYEEYITHYGFTFEEIVQEYRVRMVWNAIYLIMTAYKFNPNIDVYLATSGTTSLNEVYSKLKELHHIKYMHLLATYANESQVKQVIKFKNGDRKK